LRGAFQLDLPAEVVLQRNRSGGGLRDEKNQESADECR
jgi:hypothetical protein